MGPLPRSRPCGCAVLPRRRLRTGVRGRAPRAPRLRRTAARPCRRPRLASDACRRGGPAACRRTPAAVRRRERCARRDRCRSRRGCRTTTASRRRPRDGRCRTPGRSAPHHRLHAGDERDPPVLARPPSRTRRVRPRVGGCRVTAGVRERDGYRGARFSCSGDAAMGARSGAGRGRPRRFRMAAQRPSRGGRGRRRPQVQRRLGRRSCRTPRTACSGRAADATRSPHGPSLDVGRRDRPEPTPRDPVVGGAASRSTARSRAAGFARPRPPRPAETAPAPSAPSAPSARHARTARG